MRVHFFDREPPELLEGKAAAELEFEVRDHGRGGCVLAAASRQVAVDRHGAFTVLEGSDRAATPG